MWPFQGHEKSRYKQVLFNVLYTGYANKNNPLK